MSSELKAIRRKCIEQGKKKHTCVGCEMFQKTCLPGEKKESLICALGIPAKWNINNIRAWVEKKEKKVI
jgi:hypothetical protein